jgi:hypothetical protein
VLGKLVRSVVAAHSASFYCLFWTLHPSSFSTSSSCSYWVFSSIVIAVRDAGQIKFHSYLHASESIETVSPSHPDRTE